MGGVFSKQQTKTANGRILIEPPAPANFGALDYLGWDVLFEITSYLDPMAVRQLNKSFHGFVNERAIVAALGRYEHLAANYDAGDAQQTQLAETLTKLIADNLDLLKDEQLKTFNKSQKKIAKKVAVLESEQNAKTLELQDMNYRGF